MNLDFTFLTEDQIFGDNRLNIFEHYGTKAVITDFAILLGGYVSHDNYYYNNSNSLEDRTGCYWTSSDDKDDDAFVVNTCGTISSHVVRKRNNGGRPTLSYSLILNIPMTKVRGRDGILEVEYGEYPQKVASKRLQDELERAYNYGSSSIRKTGKTYTTDSRRYNEYDKEFSAQSIDEFEYAGKKYVRVKANSYYDGEEFILSSGERYKDGDYVWVEVSSIKWLVDEENDIVVSERILFAGVQFNHERNYKGDFKKTTIKQFMDEYFSKDIIVCSKEKKKVDYSYFKDVIFNSIMKKSDNAEAINTVLKYIRENDNNDNNKNININDIEKNKYKKLKEYGLDEESINNFRQKIKNVSQEEKYELGKKLYELLVKKHYNEETNFDEILKLILGGADIEYKDGKKGDYPLLICSRKNYIKTFTLLLKAGANVNQVNNYLTTATMASARHGNKEILELLILMNADINVRCLDGDNAIMSAKIHNEIECFNMLVNAGAILTNENQKGQTLSDLKSDKDDFNIEHLIINRNNDNTSVNTDTIFDEALSKMNEILGEEKEFMKIKK